MAAGGRGAWLDEEKGFPLPLQPAESNNARPQSQVERAHHRAVISRRQLSGGGAVDRCLGILPNEPRRAQRRRAPTRRDPGLGETAIKRTYQPKKRYRRKTP